MTITDSSSAPLRNRLSKRFFFYSLAGTSTFALDLLLVWLLISGFGVKEGVAVMIGFLIGVHINYTLQRFWVYNHTQEKLPKTYTYFISASLFFAFILPWLVWWLKILLDVDLLVARIFAGAIIGACGFLFNTFLNFKFL